jgi:rRNA biogenesis protein RRP5
VVKPNSKIIARIKSVSKDTPPKIMMHEVEECKEVMTEEYQQLQDLLSEVQSRQKLDFEGKKDEEEDEDEIHIHKDEVDQNIEDLQELLEVGEESEDQDMKEEAHKITSFLKFDEDAEGEDAQMEYAEGEDIQGEAEGEQDAEEGEGEGEEEKEEKPEKKKKKTKNAYIQEEIHTMLRERGLEEGEQDQDFYEQKLMEDSNNSFVWIHYISYVLGKKGYKEAKTLCERAVKTIDISKLKEKMNLWIAYMNLESKYGKEKEFESIVKRALKVNDQKKIYLSVIEIYKQRKNYKVIEGIYIILTRKYNFHLDVWKSYIEYLFLAHNIKDDETHEDHILLQEVDISEKEKVLSKALQILDRKQQIELIRKYATEEYKYGNTEKGRTMYESIMHSYPKRTDIIATFLDLEIRHTKNKLNVRKVFEKLLAREEVKLKQAKFLFKRYLEFEVK